MKFYAFGHENIRATHRTVIEITKDENITEKGDCIIGVKATHAILDFKEELQRFKGKGIEVYLRISDMREEVIGYVHPELTFEDERCLILRTSSFLCPKTLMINSNKAAFERLKNSRELIEIEILPLKR
ncbi:MAG: DUF371 domain-containing protein [Candidatus Methanofastidiosia archaeon]